jgi:putative transposase
MHGNNRNISNNNIGDEANNNFGKRFQNRSKNKTKRDKNGRFLSTNTSQKCRFCGSFNTVKFGYNKVKEVRKQRYWCKDCNTKFTPSNKLVKPNTNLNSYIDLQYEIDAHINKICRMAKKTIYPHIDLSLHYTAKYNQNIFLDLLTHTAVEHDFTENGARTFRIDRKKSPVGHTLLYHIGKLKINSVMKMFINCSEEMFKLAKQSDLFKQRKLDLAIDFHDIPFWGDVKHSMLVRNPKLNGTTYAFRFATIAIVEHGRRFTLLTLPVSHLDKTYRIVDQLINYAKGIINIDTVYFDRHFYSTTVIDTLKKHKVKFLMVARRDNRIQGLIKENDHGAVIDYTMGKSTTFKIVITKNKGGGKHAFATNLNVGIKRRLLSLYELYGKRWGIETTYRIIDHDFKARTTSKKYVVRLFYFLFCVCLYNLWVLTNVLLSMVSLSFIPKKLWLPAKYFGKLFVSVELIDPG